MSTEKIQTYCAMCTSRCGVVATIEDGRFTRVDADRDHPNGCICIKGSAAPEIVYSDDRLRHPLRRTRPKGDPNPGWEPISWNDALELIARRLLDIRAESGAESVAYGCATTAGSATDDVRPWLDRLFGAFGTPNFIGPGHVCTWSRLFGSKHTYGVSTPRPDTENANCILLWGINPQASDPVSAGRIAKARQRGTKLIVIDPREHTLAKKADCWLRVRPGADGALALAMLHVLFDEDLIDTDFARNWTNAPFLVRTDTGDLLSGQDISVDAGKNSWVVRDSKMNRAAIWDPETGFGDNETVPSLSGSFECPLPDGSTVRCETVLDLLRSRAAEYAPEKSTDITWVAPEDVRRAAQMFATERPSGYESWTGTEMHSGTLQMNRAIQCFYGLTGQFDAQGSNAEFAPAPSNPITAAEFLPPGQTDKRLGLADHPLGPSRDPGHIQHTPLYRAILDKDPYPVRGLVLFGSNFLVGHVDPKGAAKALKALEFYVHVDLFDNPTAHYADIILPASSTWESSAIRAGFCSSQEAFAWTQAKTPVVAPRHESRPDLEIIFDLAARLGLDSAFFGGDQEAAWNHHLSPTGLTMADLKNSPGGIPFDTNTTYRKYSRPLEVDGIPAGFATPSGRLELFASAFPAAGYPPLPDHVEPPDSPLDDDQTYPLVLTSFRVIQLIGPQNRNIPRLRSRQPDPFMEVHPETAEAAGVAEGEWAYLENTQGRVRLRTKINPSLHPRVVCAPYGWWQACAELNLPGQPPLAENSANQNLLIGSRHIDPLSGSIPHRSTRCRLVAD